MAEITVTEILGTDNVGLSRPIINENFKILKDAQNLTESFLDTDNNGTLTSGSVTIPLNAGNLTDINFTLESSGIISGNLTVNEKMKVNPLSGEISSFQINADGSVSFNQNNVTFTKNAGANDGADYNKTTFNTNVIFKGGIALDLLAGPIVPGDYNDVTPINPKKFSFDSNVTFQPLNVLNLDFVSSPGTTDVYLGDGFAGQVILLRFVKVTSQISCNIIGNIDGDGVGSPGSLALSNVSAGETLTLGYVSDGWIVLSKYGSFTV